MKERERHTYDVIAGHGTKARARARYCTFARYVSPIPLPQGRIYNENNRGVHARVTPLPPGGYDRRFLHKKYTKEEKRYTHTNTHTHTHTHIYKYIYIRLTRRTKEKK